jgi:hypothetical protein
MSNIPLRESAFATVGASGRATATIQPLRAFERWEIERYTVACTSSLLAPACRIYRGAIAAGNLVEGTFSGRQDTSDTKLTLENGEMLIAVWEGKDVGSAGADIGSACTLTVEGRAVRAVS